MLELSILTDENHGTDRKKSEKCHKNIAFEGIYDGVLSQLQLQGSLARAELHHSLVDVVVKFLACHSSLLAATIKLNVGACVEAQRVVLQPQRLLLVMISLLSLESSDAAVLLSEVQVERQVHLVAILVSLNAVDILVSNVLIQICVTFHERTIVQPSYVVLGIGRVNRKTELHLVDLMQIIQPL